MNGRKYLYISVSIVIFIGIFWIFGNSKSKSADFYGVLQEKESFAFVSDNGTETITIEKVPDIFDPNDPYMKIWDFTSLDMDEDGECEIILSVFGVSADMGGQLILHRINNQIYGYKTDSMTLVNIKADGTGEYSDPTGVSETGVCKIDEFTADGYTIKKIFYGTGTYQGLDTFVVDGHSAKEEEFLSEMENQNNKPDAVWHEFTTDNIEVYI